jgi:hypothetical protein
MILILFSGSGVPTVGCADEGCRDPVDAPAPCVGGIEAAISLNSSILYNLRVL